MEAAVLAARALSAARLLPDEGAEVGDVTADFHGATLHLICGPRGCGKNLLLRLVGLLTPLRTGELLLDGLSTGALDESERVRLRNEHFGFLFAAPFLLPSFSVVENVAMPAFKLNKADPVRALEQTQVALDFVGMGHRLECPVEELSLEEQHRVSLARALVNEPRILIAEEIDRELSGEALIRFAGQLRRAATSRGITVIASCNSPIIAQPGDRIIEMARGQIESDSLISPRT